jgi:Methyltransferase domain
MDRRLRQGLRGLVAPARHLATALRALAPGIERPLARARTGLHQAKARLDRARLVLSGVSAEQVVAANNVATDDPFLRFAPPGHFYSPLPSTGEIEAQAHRLFAESPNWIDGVELRETSQLALLDELKPFYGEQPFSASPDSERRFFFENPAYSYSDAIFLYCMLRYLRPARLIEVGSGYSSCVTLDTDELYLGSQLECTFIEPFPDLLVSLLKPRDFDRITIVQRKLEEVPLDLFRTLRARDVLFIDSTHVSKIGSDVNRLLFDVFPSLSSGVYIHIHDVFWPFEYPRHWLKEGRAWNEQYALRAFLQFNDEFEVVLFNTYLQHFHEDIFQRDFPLTLLNRGGSIWLRRR